MSSAWHCEYHGDVAPLHVLAPVGDSTVATVAARSAVPLWMPLPPPVGWTLGGIASAGDDRRTVATATAWSGPSPVGGLADLVVVAEEPGVGLGARLAGLPHVDAGDCVSGPPVEHVDVRGRPVALWPCPGTPADRIALVGEADAAWLWTVLWPAPAEALFAERLLLADARERSAPYQPGAASSRLLAS